jgi:hypothetical protein
MSNARSSALTCCILLLALAFPAHADEGDSYQAVSRFNANKKTKASATPTLRTVMSVPADLAQGDVFVVNCVVETYKNAKGAPSKGVTGSVATFANLLDVGSGSWSFFGLVGSGLPFTTGKDGSIAVTTGPVTAGIWANNNGGNDNISISASFTNKKRVQATSLECELVVGDTGA